VTARGAGAVLRRWWFPPEPLARIALLRTLVYLFVVYDMVMLVNDVVPKGDAPAGLYQPVLIPRLLEIPPPTMPVVQTLQAVLLVATLVAATGRLPRLAGWVVAVAFLYWLFIDMSYGKIDHDHFAMVVALFVLPTVGRARLRDTARSEAAGWALRCIQIAVVATYFLSAWAKMRWGGAGWPNGATFYWAMSRRGTGLGQWVMETAPVLLIVGQWVVLVAEFASVALLFARGPWRLFGVLFFAGFHLLTYLTIGIHFLPTLILWLAFFPVERLPLAAGRFARRLRLPGSRMPGRLGPGPRPVGSGQDAGGGAAGKPVAVAGDEPVEQVR
jgi:hypothetical protein